MNRALPRLPLLLVLLLLLLLVVVMLPSGEPSPSGGEAAAGASRGDAEKAQQAKRGLLFSVLGVIVVLMSVIIVNFFMAIVP